MLLGITAEVQLHRRFLKPPVSRLAGKGKAGLAGKGTLSFSNVWGHLYYTDFYHQILYI